MDEWEDPDDYMLDESEPDSDDEGSMDEPDDEEQYFSAKEKGDISEAIPALERVLELESQKGEWGFKALKRMVKLYYQNAQIDLMLEKYRQFLTYTKTAVTRNVSEKAISRILSRAETTTQLPEFYTATLTAMKEAKNEKFWFKINTKLANLYFQKEDYDAMNQLCAELLTSCTKADGSLDQDKGSQVLEVYALQIQMYTLTRDNKKLKQIYEKSLQIKNVLVHPRITGVIRECGGKMHMYERDFVQAHTDFFEAFKAYDEAGAAARRIQCLKYLVLANMLMKSDINPFQAQETRDFRNDKEVAAMTGLIEAYQQNDIPAFERILQENEESILGDAFIRLYIEDLMENIRTAKLLVLLSPYTSLRLPYLAAQLNTPVDKVEALLVSLILDGKIEGRIDQVNQILILEGRNQAHRKHAHLQRWASEIRGQHHQLLARL